MSGTQNEVHHTIFHINVNLLNQTNTPRYINIEFAIKKQVWTLSYTNQQLCSGVFQGMRKVFIAIRKKNQAKRERTKLPHSIALVIQLILAVPSSSWFTYSIVSSCDRTHSLSIVWTKPSVLGVPIVINRRSPKIWREQLYFNR